MANNFLLAVEEIEQLSASAKKNILQWLTHKKYLPYVSELEELIQKQQWQTLEDAFFRVIPFGTGGRRGTVGIGSNRINDITVGEVAQALCTYLEGLHGSDVKQQGIVVAYDSRNTSEHFTKLIAEVCAGNGFKVYVYTDVRSTPQLSYSVRSLKTAAGIVVSASHNPSPDNGVKVYWNDGGQMVSPYDKELLAVAEDVEEIKTLSFQEGLKTDLIVRLDAKADENYFQAVLEQIKQPQNSKLSIAYSPLHGAGKSSVFPVLQKAGFDVRLFKPQAEYDGDFTNVTNHIANPEVPEASDKVVAFAKESGCDLAITTDPDADRLGVVVIVNGEADFLSGNQTASLIAYHILETLKQSGKLKSNQFIAKTIVTTDLLSSLAEHYGVEVKGNLLVGFKYIGELIRLHVDEGQQEFLFGGEESFGGLVGTYARDKDAASSALMIAELAASAKNQGKTLRDILDELYESFGYYHELLSSTIYPGADGFETMKHIMNKLRAEPPVLIGGMPVVRVRDYLTGDEILDRTEDVLRFELSEDGTDRVTIRPSGTEPKIKIYVQTKTTFEEDIAKTKQSGVSKAELLLKSSKEFLG